MGGLLFRTDIAKSLRACLESSNEDSDKGKRKNLSGNKKLTFTIFPKPTEFVEPSKKTLHHPTAGQNNKFMQFTALYYLNLCTANVLDLIGKAFTRITSIHQKLLHAGKIVQIKQDHLNSTFPICNVSSCYCYSVRKSHCIYNNVTLDPGYFFPASYPFSSAVSAF